MDKNIFKLYSTPIKELDEFAQERDTCFLFESGINRGVNCKDSYNHRISILINKIIIEIDVREVLDGRIEIDEIH